MTARSSAPSAQEPSEVEPPRVSRIWPETDGASWLTLADVIDDLAEAERQQAQTE